MKRYWINAQSTFMPHHRHNGKVVLASTEGDEPMAYLMDLTVPQTSFLVSRRYLTEWHDYQPDHKFCFCTSQRRAEQAATR